MRCAFYFVVSLAASRFCNKQYETAAKCFDRAAAFLVKFKGIDHVDREVLGSQLEKLYRDDVIRLGLSYGQILAHVQVRIDHPELICVFFNANSEQYKFGASDFVK